MNQIGRISPVTDAEAGRLVQPDTLADLAGEITATSGPGLSGPASTPGFPHRSAHRSAHRRGWLIAAPLAAGLAAAVLAITSVGSPGQVHRREGVPTGTPPAAAAQLLSFTRHGGYITVIVRNPLADTARYNAVFARHHLNIRLSVVPASPSQVGTLIFADNDPGITPITARGHCFAGGRTSRCPVGLRVPVNFHGRAKFTFGRAARPGEPYQAIGSAFAPGEAMHGLIIRGKTVAQVLAVLHRRLVTVPMFNHMNNNIARNVRHVPGRWFVYNAVPWAPGQVMLFVGPARTQPAPGQPAPEGRSTAPPAPGAK